MKLYDYSKSSAAYRLRIALNLKGLDYEKVNVNLLHGEQKGDDYKALNPQGLVPALEDKTLYTQSLAILEYLEEAYPQTPLLPNNLADKTQVRALALSIACDIHPLNNLRVLKYLTVDMALSEEQKMQWYHHWISEGFTALEKQLAETAGTFSFGDAPSIVDVCLVPQVFNANRFKVPMDAFPTIKRIVAQCETLEAFKLAHPDA
ncbi:maleylacetoacetate isomerase [Thalassotalea agarivorans]|uniref:Maleylpyruvate isomerase n=1 Tax=Thalassotalea agarivorans TaxID=349064 RepID=A0A1I0E0W6_THASX|nr:maleylacetoacetate isomerase [Thalassotalea agarivorans]SET38353.1 maleylpyruvate isomerase [Thalassotalea agarivorans]